MSDGSVHPALSTDPDRDPLDGPIDEALLREASETCAMLASPTRLHIVLLLSRGEHDVSTLCEQLGASGPSVSQHLAKLRLAGLVTARRDGRHQLYSVEDPHITLLARQAIDHHRDLRDRAAALTRSSAPGGPTTTVRPATARPTGRSGAQ